MQVLLPVLRLKSAPFSQSGRPYLGLFLLDAHLSLIYRKTKRTPYFAACNFPSELNHPFFGGAKAHCFRRSPTHSLAFGASSGQALTCTKFLCLHECALSTTRTCGETHCQSQFAFLPSTPALFFCLRCQVRCILQAEPQEKQERSQSLGGYGTGDFSGTALAGFPVAEWLCGPTFSQQEIQPASLLYNHLGCPPPGMPPSFAFHRHTNKNSICGLCSCGVEVLLITRY